MRIEDCESFEEFYPLYLAEHRNRTNRRLHFIGSTFSLMLFSIFIFTLDLKFFLFALIIGYGFAWVGHFFFEKNKPATFKKPLYSFMGDWVMYKDILTNKIYF